MLVLAVHLTLLLTVLPPHDIPVEIWGWLRPWSDLAALGLGMAVLGLGARWERSRLPGFVWPALTFLGIGLCSAVANQTSLLRTAEGLREIAPYPLAAAALATRLEREDVEDLLQTAYVSAVVLSVYGILSYLTFRVAGSPTPSAPLPKNAWDAVFLYPYYCGHYAGGWRLVSTFLNDNFFGIWLAMLMPYGWVRFSRTAETGARLGWLAALVLLGIAFTFTFSRTAVIAFGAGLLFFAVRADRRVLWLIVPLLVVGALFATGADLYRFGAILAHGAGRWEAVEDAGRALRFSPLWGLGPGTRGLADVQYAKVAFETGLLGLGVFAWLMAGAFRPVFRPRAREAGPTAAALGAGLVVLFVSGFGSDAWEIPQLAVLGWLFAALLCVLGRGAATEEIAGPEVVHAR